MTQTLKPWSLVISVPAEFCGDRSARVTLGFHRRRAFENNGRVGAILWRAFDENRLKVAAGGCGGCGLTAGADLMAMGIESYSFANN